jgi:hypothetical protein
MVRCTWDSTDDQAAEQTAHPTAVRAGGRVFGSSACTQIDGEPGDCFGVRGAEHSEATLDRIGAQHAPLVRELVRNLVTAPGTRAVRDRGNRASRA